MLTVALGTWLKAHEERSAPAASIDGAALETPSSPGSPVPVLASSPGSLVRIDATTGEIVARVPIQFPTLLAADGPWVWVFSEGTVRTRLVRVAGANAAVTGTFDVELPVGRATALAAAGGGAWLGDNHGKVYGLAPGASVIDPVNTFEVPGDVGFPNFVGDSLVGAADSLWVSWFPPGGCCRPPPDLYRVDPDTERVIARIEDATQVVASGTGFVWALRDQPQKAPLHLVRIDTETHATVPIGALEFLWADLTVADGAVWASSRQDDTIVRLDPLTGDENERIRVEGGPGKLAAGAGAVWAAISDNGTVARYDIETGRIETIDVGGTPNDLVFANGSVWVTVFGPTQTQPYVPGVASGPFLLDLRTGEKTPVPKNIARGYDYAASLDGTRLAYVGIGEEGNLQIFMAGSDGTGGRQMTHVPTGGGAKWPAVSPDGTMIAYVGKGYGLFVLDVATGESTRITDETSRWSGQPQFTPDGSSLIYTGGSFSRPVLRIVPVAGGKSTILFGLGEGLTDSGKGSLSPDGSLVTFVGGGSFGSGHCGPCRFVANADGTDRRVILDCSSNPAGAWSPDGNRIVCVDEFRGIIVIDIATRAATPVAEGSGAIWLDGHTLLVEA